MCSGRGVFTARQEWRVSFKWQRVWVIGPASKIPLLRSKSKATFRFSIGGVFNTVLAGMTCRRRSVVGRCF